MDGNEVSEKTLQYNPYKELVAKYEALVEIQRNSRTKPQQMQQQQPQSLHDELNSTDFSSLNTKYTSEDEKKAGDVRHKTPDFSEVETSSSGFSDEISSTKATQTDNSSFLFSIVDGEDCKFSIYDDATSAPIPIETRFRERPKYRELFKEIFTVLKKAAENKEEGESLPLLDDNEKAVVEEVSKVPPVTPATENIPACKDFDVQSIISSAISENSVAISECITKTERKKAKSHKKQAAKEEIENKPPSSVVQVIGGKLVTPYNRVALDFAALNAKKRARRSRLRSKDKYGNASGRDSSAASDASTSKAQSNYGDDERKEVNKTGSEAACVEKAPLTPTKVKKLRRPRELMQLQTLSTLATGEWNGDSITIYNKKSKVNNPVDFYCRPTTVGNEIPFKSSAASNELRKLKKLDLSYAEVLKQNDRRYRGQKHK